MLSLVSGDAVRWCCDYLDSGIILIHAFFSDVWTVIYYYFNAGLKISSLLRFTLTVSNFRLNLFEINLVCLGHFMWSSIQALNLQDKLTSTIIYWFIQWANMEHSNLLPRSSFRYDTLFGIKSRRLFLFSSKSGIKSNSVMWCEEKTEFFIIRNPE